MNKVDAEYLERRKKEKMAQNIIKWWNVQRAANTSKIGSLELEDPLYGCHIYEASSTPLHSEESVATQEPDSTPPDTIANTPEEDEEAIRLANEIFERLSREAEADQAQKDAEIAAAMAKQQEVEAACSNADYNEATGSYSGLYGQKPMDESEADQFAAIMAQNGSIGGNVADLVQQQQIQDPT